MAKGVVKEMGFSSRLLGTDMAPAPMRQMSSCGAKASTQSARSEGPPVELGGSMSCLPPGLPVRPSVQQWFSLALLLQCAPACARRSGADVWGLQISLAWDERPFQAHCNRTCLGHSNGGPSKARMPSSPRT